MTRRAEIPFLIFAVACTLAACSAPAPRQQIARTPRVEAPRPDAAQASPEARFEAALALMKSHQTEEAQAAFLALARDFPELSGALTNLGILYAQSRQRDAAVESFSRAVNANPKNAVALNWLGVLYRESGDYARAEHAYRAALAARPDYAPAHLNLGILYDVFLKRPRDALAQYRSYQQYAGAPKGRSDLIVAAWIKELEAQTATAGAGHSGVAP